MSNDSIGSISPVSDASLAAPVQEANTAPVEDTAAASEEIEDDGSDLAIDGVEVQEAVIDAAAKAGEITKQQAQSMKKKLKLKVNGVEEEVEFDLSDEQALIRELQKSRAFDKSAKEHAGFKSQVDQLMSMLRSDPESVLERLGMNVDDLAEKRLSKRVEEMKKSPEQIKQEKLEAELEGLRKEKKEAEEAKIKAEEEKFRNAAAAEIETDISQALESKSSFLPKKSPWVLSKVAQYMMMGMKNGHPNVSAKDVIPLVEKAYREELQDLMGGASEEMLEQLVGKANLDRYRKSIISKKKASPPTPSKPKIEDTGSRRSQKEEEEPKKYRMKDLFGYRK